MEKESSYIEIGNVALQKFLRPSNFLSWSSIVKISLKLWLEHLGFADVVGCGIQHIHDIQKPAVINLYQELFWNRKHQLWLPISKFSMRANIIQTFLIHFIQWNLLFSFSERKHFFDSSLSRSAPRKINWNINQRKWRKLN